MKAVFNFSRFCYKVDRCRVLVSSSEFFLTDFYVGIRQYELKAITLQINTTLTII